VNLAHPNAAYQLAMITSGRNVRQLDRGNPNPTQPLQQSLLGHVVIQSRQKTQPNTAESGCLP